MTETTTDAAPKPGVKRLALIWRFARAYPLQLVAALVALVVAAGATVAIPQGLKLVVDQGFGAASPATIAPYFKLMLGIVIVLGLSTATRFYFVSWLGERVVADLRRAVQAHLLRLDPSFFEENRPSEIASRLTSDTAVIEQVVGTTASVALRNLFVGLGGIGYMFIQSPKFTGLILLVIPLAIGPVVLLGRRVRGLSRASQDRIASVGSTVSETLSAMRIVQAFTQEPHEERRFAEVVEAVFAAAKRRIATRAMLTAIVIMMIFGSIVLGLWSLAIDVVEGHLTGGTATGFVLATGLVAGAFGALTEVYGDLMRGAGAAGRMVELLDARPGIQAPASPVALPEPAAGRLSLDHVTFRYPSKPDMPAVIDFTLDVAGGETVAVVGPSGAGKSTLFQLIQRFYDPQAGTIRLDGVALPEADPRAIRERIALVPQESVIFAASAYDNILYGRPGASEEEVWAAAEAANAGRFLKELSNGIHSYLGEAGTRLSGGQRQRLAIARAVLRDAPVLLLDEATSALDAESERLVQDALDRLMEGRTTLVIAHRLATVRGADRIVVMDAGRIVAQGRHEALLAENGLYARLAKLQFEDAA